MDVYDVLATCDSSEDFLEKIATHIRKDLTSLGIIATVSITDVPRSKTLVEINLVFKNKHDMHLYKLSGRPLVSMEKLSLYVGTIKRKRIKYDNNGSVL